MKRARALQKVSITITFFKCVITVILIPEPILTL
jgi:hypothetical protein